MEECLKVRIGGLASEARRSALPSGSIPCADALRRAGRDPVLRPVGSPCSASPCPQRWPAQVCLPRQAPREVEARACEALADLRARKLLSFREPDGGGAPAWAASERGRAVYESALPTRLGERLYEVRRLRLFRRERAPRMLRGAAACARTRPRALGPPAVQGPARSGRRMLCRARVRVPAPSGSQASTCAAEAWTEADSRSIMLQCTP